MKRAGACALLMAAALLATAPASKAADPWYESYAAALKAISSRNWANAEAKLKAAIRDGPAPGRGVRTYGVRFVDYQPGFYLGLVYFNQQRYKEALDELKRVQAASLIVKGDAEFQQLGDMIELASMRVGGKPSDTQKEAETLIRFARDLLAQDSLDEARRAYESAKQKDPGNTGLPALGEAIAKKATERKAKADDEAKLRDSSRKAELESSVEAARQLLGAKRYKDLRDAVARARSAGLADPRFDDLLASADLGEKTQIEKRPSPEALPKPAGGAHQLEGTALRAFYSGKYQTSADILGELASSDARSARVLFYLACSNSALGLLRGKDGEALVLKARQQWAEAKRLDKTFAPDERLISPRIIAALRSR